MALVCDRCGTQEKVEHVYVGITVGAHGEKTLSFELCRPCQEKATAEVASLYKARESSYDPRKHVRHIR